MIGVFMSKFEVSYSEDAIVFVNTRTNVAEKLSMFDVLDTDIAVKAIKAEQHASISASYGAVSLLSAMLDNPRLDEYRGTCPLGEKIPNELKSAIREIEVEFLKPIFISTLPKTLTAGKAGAAWDDYVGKLKEGGSYAVAKGHITKLFAYTGNLPKHGTKLLTVAAIKKLLENLEKPEAEKTGIAGKLVALSLELRKENSDEGSAIMAIAALKAMLVFYEAREIENAEAAQVAHEAILVGDVTPSTSNVSIDAQAKAIVSKAVGAMQRAPRPVTEDATF
jgi:hypothetical protein